jgi:hypothetical protein
VMEGFLCGFEEDGAVDDAEKCEEEHGCR